MYFAIAVYPKATEQRIADKRSNAVYARINVTIPQRETEETQRWRVGRHKIHIPMQG